MTTLDKAALEAAARTLPRVWPGGFEDQRQKDDSSGWANPPWTPNDFAREVAGNAVAAYLSALPAQPVAVCDVIAERQRQKSAEGWTEAHDDQHVRGEMALAAACYAVAEYPSEAAGIATRELWPWDTAWWKPKGFRRNLVRAAALIIAEIERLDRVTASRMTAEELRRLRPSGTRRPTSQPIPLAAPSQQEGVTEEMVEAACIAKYGSGDLQEWLRGLGVPPRTFLRLALEAALVDRVKPGEIGERGGARQ